MLKPTESVLTEDWHDEDIVFIRYCFIRAYYTLSTLKYKIKYVLIFHEDA